MFPCCCQVALVFVFPAASYEGTSLHGQARDFFRRLAESICRPLLVLQSRSRGAPCQAGVEGLPLRFQISQDVCVKLGPLRTHDSSDGEYAIGEAVPQDFALPDRRSCRICDDVFFFENSKKIRSQKFVRTFCREGRTTIGLGFIAALRSMKRHAFE